MGFLRIWEAARARAGTAQDRRALKNALVMEALGRRTCVAAASGNRSSFQNTCPCCNGGVS